MSLSSARGARRSLYERRTPRPLVRVHRRMPARVRAALLGALGIVVALVVWQVLAAWMGQFKLPSPASLLPDLVSFLFAQPLLAGQGLGSAGLLPHLLYTVAVASGSTVAGTVIGTLLALFGFRWHRMGAVIDTWLGVLRSVPPIAAIPFAILWLGPTLPAQIAIVVFYVAVMSYVTTAQAALTLDPVLARFASTTGSSPGRILRTVIAPAVVPALAGGVRVAFGIAIGVQVVAEYLGSQMGIGQVFNRMVPYQALSVIIVGILWITILTFVIDRIFVLAIRRATRWVP